MVLSEGREEKEGEREAEREELMNLRFLSLCHVPNHCQCSAPSVRTCCLNQCHLLWFSLQHYSALVECYVQGDPLKQTCLNWPAKWLERHSVIERMHEKDLPRIVQVVGLSTVEERKQNGWEIVRMVMETSSELLFSLGFA